MDRTIVSFFVLAFAWTWAWQAPVILGLEGPASLALLALAGLGPSLAAIAVTRGRLFGELRWRVSLGWALVAVALPIAIRGASLAIDAALGADLPDSPWVVGALGVMVLPPLGEELGAHAAINAGVLAKGSLPIFVLVGVAVGLVTAVALGRRDRS